MHITASTISLTVDNPTHLGFREAMAAEGFVSLTRDDAAADIVLLRRGSEVLPTSRCRCGPSRGASRCSR